MCAVCNVHAWNKARSVAFCKPRIIHDTLFQALDSHKRRHLPLYWSSSTVIELGAMDSMYRVAAGASGFFGAFQCGAFFLVPALAFFGGALKNFSTLSLRCFVVASAFFLIFLAHSNVWWISEASRGFTSSIRHCFGITLGSTVLSGFSKW